MKRILILVAAVSLLLCSKASAFQGGGGESTKNPKSTPKRTTSQQPAQSGDWNTFWNAFRTAINKHNRAALKGMISNPFDSGGGGDYSPNELIKFMDDNKLWRDTQRSVASGTKSFETHGRDVGRPSRITNNRHLIFVLGKDGRWRWVAVMGD